MKKLRLIKIYGLSALIITTGLMAYPPQIGSGQSGSVGANTHIPKADISYDIAELKHDVEKLREKETEIIKKVRESTRVVVKTKTVVKVKDSAAIWLRHPDGSVQRIVFSTSQVPIINLVADTITDTVKLKRKWVLFGPYREF